jgi:hypothetical protein
MNLNNKGWFKYPDVVYYSARVDTTRTKICSDYLTDYRLCSEGLYFMEDQNGKHKSMQVLKFPDNKFEMKNIENGTKFYKANSRKDCTMIQSAFEQCMNSIKDADNFIKSGFQNNPQKFRDMNIASES